MAQKTTAQDKQQKLDAIKAQILAENICPDLAASAMQLVFGDGPADAKIVFIGEAPGKNEDLQGIPFVGAAGKFLNEMLGTINLKREDIYITNIVKYRPPNNRDPLPDEKAAFLPFLQAQLDAIQPLLVITLGRHSMNCFLPDLQISQIHGQPKRIQVQFMGDTVTKLVILPLFHPAAALYNGGMRQTLIDDFAKIPTIINMIETANTITS
ncbi:MAG TPA: uracil-DNA glycosylase [Candidatus Saccharimonadales bacterium]|nr:uracil-DNA glycosylase [Candidatus Saccharimonadales bacterium]